MQLPFRFSDAPSVKIVMEVLSIDAKVPKKLNRTRGEVLLIWFAQMPLLQLDVSTTRTSRHPVPELSP